MRNAKFGDVGVKRRIGNYIWIIKIFMGFFQ
jgi:hypothetical protein